MRRQRQRTEDQIVRESIAVPAEYCGSPWVITYPRLKLGLKYGLIGPWKGNNWSQAFDAYTAKRWPDARLPTVTDMVASVLMNSRASTTDLKTLTGMLNERPFARMLEGLRSRLAQYASLEAAPRELAHLIGDTAQRIWDRNEKKAGGIGKAKAFKWLAAWAPAHVPMVDALVFQALAGNARPRDLASCLNPARPCPHRRTFASRQSGFGC